MAVANYSKQTRNRIDRQTTGSKVAARETKNA